MGSIKSRLKYLFIGKLDRPVETGWSIRITEKEEQGIGEFKKAHRNCKGKHKTGIQFSYIITPTGIGDCVAVKCNRCGKTKDVTDVDCW